MCLKMTSNCLSCRVAFALPAWQMVLEVITEIMCLPAHGHVFTRCTLFTQDCLFLKEICTFWRALHNSGEQKLSKLKLPIVRPRFSHSQKTRFTFNESLLSRVSPCFLWVYLISTHPLNYLTVVTPPCLGSVAALVTNQSFKEMVWLTTPEKFWEHVSQATVEIVFAPLSSKFWFWRIGVQMKCFLHFSIS